MITDEEGLGMSWQLVQHILILGSLAGLATTGGSVLSILMGKPRENIMALMLGAAGGVMLAVVLIDLLPSIWAMSGGILTGVTGIAAGAALMMLAINFLHNRPMQTFSRRQKLKNTGLLISMGIALHDIPEGMAIAVGHGAAGKLGGLIAIAVTLHNLPEGMASAVPLMMAGIKRTKILLLSVGLAFFTLFGSAIGLVALNFINGSLTFFLGLAAGSMGTLVMRELLPLSRERHPNWSKLGITIGFVLFSLISIFI